MESYKQKQLREALKKYANNNSISDNDANYVLSQIPKIEAKISLISQNEIEEIKKNIGKEKIKELETILKEIR